MALKELKDYSSNWKVKENALNTERKKLLSTDKKIEGSYDPLSGIGEAQF